jgi:hypothetical protein
LIIFCRTIFEAIKSSLPLLESSKLSPNSSQRQNLELQMEAIPAPDYESASAGSDANLKWATPPQSVSESVRWRCSSCLVSNDWKSGKCEACGARGDHSKQGTENASSSSTITTPDPAAAAAFVAGKPRAGAEFGSASASSTKAGAVFSFSAVPKSTTSGFGFGISAAAGASASNSTTSPSADRKKLCMSIPYRPSLVRLYLFALLMRLEGVRDVSGENSEAFYPRHLRHAALPKQKF